MSWLYTLQQNIWHLANSDSWLYHIIVYLLSHILYCLITDSPTTKFSRAWYKWGDQRLNNIKHLQSLSVPICYCFAYIKGHLTSETHDVREYWRLWTPWSCLHFITATIIDNWGWTTSQTTGWGLNYSFTITSWDPQI